MKVEIQREKASRLINCGEVILITSAYLDKTTITTCAWHMPVSKDPALVAVALAKKHFSSQLILQSKEFVINIPSWELLDKVMFCGSVSGRSQDKLNNSGFHYALARTLTSAPIISECLGAIECGLYASNETGDHYIFVGEVKYAEANNDFFNGDIWDSKSAKLIFHLGGKYFFSSQGYTELKK